MLFAERWTVRSGDCTPAGTRPTKPLYRDGGIHRIALAPAWIVYEHLAVREPEKAIAVLKKKRSVTARRLRAAVFGALGDTEGQLREWEAVASGRGPVELWCVDWFVMTRPVANSPRFWHALHALGRRLQGMGPVPNGGVWDAVPGPAGARWNSAAQVERRYRRGRLVMRYHIARTKKDHAAARKLVERYPQWTGARRLVEVLGR